MTLTIDVTPGEEAWLAERAAQQGVEPSVIIKQLIDAQLPGNAPLETPGSEREYADPTAELFAQWAIEDATPGLSARSLVAIAYLDARIEEGKNASPEDRRIADLEVQELMCNLKANREFSG
jgi:hypothetical protein